MNFESILSNYHKVTNTLDLMSVVYSSLIYFNNFVHGYSIIIIGVTLVDLAAIYQVSLDTISYIHMVIYFGFGIGSLLGLSYRWINRQLVLILAMFLSTVIISLVPHYRTIWVAYPAMVLNGIGSGAWASSCNTWLVELWPGSNAIMLQVNYFMYGIGAILAPLITAPYIYGNANRTRDGAEELTVEMRIKSLTVPFLIVGALQLIAPIAMSILFVTNRYEKKVKPSAPIEIELKSNISESPVEKVDNIEDAQQLSNSQVSNRKLKLTLCGFCMALSVSAKICYFTYSSAMFQNLSIHLTAQQAAHVMAVLSAAYTLGPLVTAFVSIKLKPDHIVSYHFVLILASLAVLYFGQSNIYLIYTGSAILGYGFSVLWPAMLAFTELYLKLNNGVSSMFSGLLGVMNMIIPFVLGQTFKSFPLILLICETIFVVISLVLFITVRTWIYCKH